MQYAYLGTVGGGRIGGRTRLQEGGGGGGIQLEKSTQRGQKQKFLKNHFLQILR